MADQPGWLNATTQTQASYLGQVGQPYYFRAKAIDLVGNTPTEWEQAGPVSIEPVTKYYTFGGQKIAMRRGTEVRMRISTATTLARPL